MIYPRQLLKPLLKDRFSNLSELARCFTRAEGDFCQAWEEYYETIPSLPRNRFWELIEPFKTITKKYTAFRNGDRNAKLPDGRRQIVGLNRAVSMFFRGAALAELNCNLIEAIQFCRTWEEVSEELKTTLGMMLFPEMFEPWEELEYHWEMDFIEALPILGREFCEKQYESEEEFEDDLSRVEQWERIFINSENSILGCFIFATAKCACDDMGR